MQEQDILKSIAIATPCSANWDEMSGDERVRLCSLCNKNVYNLSEMTSREAVELLTVKEGKPVPCIRMFQRHDGTIITDDCPVGLRKIRDAYRRVRNIAAGLIALILSVGVAKADDKAPGCYMPRMGKMVASPNHGTTGGAQQTKDPFAPNGNEPVSTYQPQYPKNNQPTPMMGAPAPQYHPRMGQMLSVPQLSKPQMGESTVAPKAGQPGSEQNNSTSLPNGAGVHGGPVSDPAHASSHAHQRSKPKQTQQ